MKKQVVPVKTKLNALERADKGELVKNCCPVTFGQDNCKRMG